MRDEYEGSDEVKPSVDLLMSRGSMFSPFPLYSILREIDE